MSLSLYVNVYLDVLLLEDILNPETDEIVIPAGTLLDEASGRYN